ncbi:nuclear transport factor 2 family protein [Alkalihalobacillus sp. FSL W8-0930]
MVESALREYIRATNTHDFKEVAKCLHPSAMYWFSDETCTSLEDIKMYFERAWKAMPDEVYRANEIVWLSKDMKSASCTYSYHYEGHINGILTVGNGRATNVFIFVEDQWKLIHEHLSPSPNE